MKQKLLLKTMLLLCALITGSSSVWATDVTLSSAQIKAGSGSTSYGACSATDGGGNTWNAYAIKNQHSKATSDYNFWQIKKYASSTAYYVQVPELGTKITSITITVSSTSKARDGGDNSATLYFSASNSTSDTGTGVVSGTGASSVIIDCSSLNLNTGYITASGAVRIWDITVTYTAGGGGGSSVATPSFDPIGGTYTTAQSVALACATDGATIHYTMTIDGTTPEDPTESDATYSSAISVTKTGTKIKAKAFKSGESSTVASATYTIVPNGPTFSPDGGNNLLLGSTATLSSTNTIYYTITTDGSTPTAPTTSSTEYTDPIVLSGTINKIKAIAVDAYSNSSSVISKTFNCVAPTSLPFNWAGGGKSSLTALIGVNGNGLGSDYADSYSPYLVKLDTSDDNILIFTDEKPVKVTMGVKMIGGGTTSKIKVQESADGAAFTDVQELTISGSQNDIVNLATSNSFATTTRVIKLLFDKGSNVGVGPISVFSDDDIPVTITTAKWASFSNASALDFTGTGVTPYIAKSNGGSSSVTLIDIAKVPAETGIVVNAEAAGTYAIPVLGSSADATTGNLLKAWLTSGTPGDAKYYTLGLDGSGNPKFKLSTGGTLAGGKSYLVMPSGAPSLGVDFGETTGIDEVRGQKEEVRGEFYNLNGQRVAQPTKGLYIVNGKKVIIK